MNNNINNNINKLIDNCIDTNSDYNIALVLFNVFKNDYRYIGKKIWQYYNYDTKSWLIDNNCTKFKHDIDTIISNKFIDRILYYSNLSTNNNTDCETNTDISLIINKLLLCSNKLKNEKYIITIIKEARALFEYV